MLELRIPPKLVDVFTGEARYRGAYGGRSSGKTRTFATMTAVRALMLAEAGHSGVILCAREYMNSLHESSMEEVKQAIAAEPLLADYFEVGEKFIRTKNKRVSYRFTGLRHNVDSIKSKARILIAWIDEAETVSEIAWQKLLPTVRESASEVWVTWNPENPESPTNQRFRINPPARSKVIELNHSDNPFMPAVMEELRLSDMERLNPEIYEWIWEGRYLENSEAQVFAKKFKVEEFEPGKEWHGPYYGIDWGFSTDPTVGVKCWIWDNCLFIEYEAGKVGLENDDIAKFFIERLPGIEKHAAYADSARPETISHVRNARHGRMNLPNLRGVKKWPGSVEDGIFHMKSYRSIVIHPRCAEIRSEFVKYSYKRDRLSGDVLPEIIDAHNHYIDATRYALSPMIRQTNLVFEAM